MKTAISREDYIRLRNKNNKLLISSETMQEAYRAVESGYNVTIKTNKLNEPSTREFLKAFKLK